MPVDGISLERSYITRFSRGDCNRLAPPLFSNSGYGTGKCVCVFYRQKSNEKISSTSQTGQASKSLDKWSARKGNLVPEVDANS